MHRRPSTIIAFLAVVIVAMTVVTKTAMPASIAPAAAKPEWRRLRLGDLLIQKYKRSRNLILSFDTEKSAKEFQPPKGFRIIRRWFAQVTVASEKPLSATTTRLLEHRKDVRHVAVEQRVASRSSSECTNCDYPTSIPSDLQCSINFLKDASSKCKLQNVCRESGLSDDWDIKATNLDLMQEAMRTMNVDLRSAKIAVVDSPVDAAALINLSQNIEPGNVKANPDTSGHGTFVASRVLAAVPDSRIVSYSVADASGTATTSSIGETVQRACADGMKVINLSMGVAVLDMLPIDLGVMLPNLAPYLEERGCILVQASGNERDAKKRLQTSSKSPFLLVGSVDRDGERSSFTNDAQIFAPGSDVSGSLPTGSKLLEEVQTDKTTVCEGHRRKLRGTSFAAPIVAAVTNAVYAILKQNPGFANLKGDEQVGLVKAVVLDSSRRHFSSNVVDGLKAVNLAQHLRNAADLPTTPVAMGRFFKENGVFKGTAPSKVQCNEIRDDCAARTSCFNSKRKWLALEAVWPEDERAVREDLYLTALNSGEFELAENFATRFPAKVQSDLSAKADQRNLTKRLDDVSELGAVSEFIRSIGPHNVSSELKEKFVERLRDQILTADRTLPVEQHLTYLIGLREKTDWLDRKAFAQKVWQESNAKLDDRSIAALVSWAVDDHDVADSALTMEGLSHPNSGEYSLRVATANIVKLKSEKETIQAAKLALSHAARSDGSLAILLSAMSKAPASDSERLKVWSEVLAQPKFGKLSYLRALQNLNQLVPEISKREEFLRSFDTIAKRMKLSSEERSLFIAEAVTSAAGLPASSSLPMVREMLKHPAVTVEIRGAIANAFLERFEKPLELLKELSKSRAGYAVEPMGGLETYILLSSKKLTPAEKVEFISSLTPNQLPPKTTMEVHAERLMSPEDQRRLMALYR